MKVIIRDLRVEDAEISWKWRNDSEVWKNTVKTWDNEITKEIEEAWIKDVISRKNEKRFAICVEDNEKYIGNIHLNNITQYEAECHIVIGDKVYWNKGVGIRAKNLIDEYARDVMCLKRVYVRVKDINKASLALLAKDNMTLVKEEDGFIYLVREL